MKPLNTLKIAYLFTSLLLLGACEFNENENLLIERADLSDLKLENRKFSFASKEELASKIELLKRGSRENAEKLFRKFYEKGFIPMEEPIIASHDVELLEKIFNKKKQLQSRSVDSTDNSNLIGDKVFVAFINDDNEIIVDGKLYKFSSRGLFFGELKDSLRIRNYVSTSSQNRSTSRTSMCEYRRSEGGIREVEDGIHRFIRPVEDDEICGGGSSGGSGGGSGVSTGTPSANPRYSAIGLNSLIQNLRVVTNPDDNWFQNIFGEYRYAHEYFSDDEYRFELDYWNQTWLIYRSLGVEAETHEEGWFWWNNVDSDEIILGINKVHLQYNLPQPNLLFYHNYVNHSFNQFFQPLYIHDGSFFIKNNNSNYDPVQIKVLNNTQLPFFEFKNEAVLNIYIGKPLNISINYNVLNESNIRALYKLGIDFLESKLGTTDKPFYITLQSTGDKVDVLLFDKFDRKYNTDEVENKFDSDWAFSASVKTLDAGQTWTSDYGLQNLSGAAFNYLGNYTHKEVDVYGLARRGNEWRGLRLKF
ncbi:MAG: hypothetical protein GKR88_15680 [Flavobacteriaceae bacterium]|nr:MAG: hypothetical protein GKR88_15680 [Flavobacteriaceae bacterium]